MVIYTGNIFKHLVFFIQSIANIQLLTNEALDMM